MKSIFIFLFILCVTAVNAQTFTNSTITNIPDLGPVIEVPVTVSGMGNQINAVFGLYSACIEVVHTYDADLVIKLRAPDGTVIELVSGAGNSDDNFTGTCLAENGTGYINTGTAPFTGVYHPMQSLNLLNNNQDPNGIWHFLFQDTFGADSGYVSSCSLTFQANPPADPGPPAIMCSGCQCPPGVSPPCDLLPDMTASGKIIQESIVEINGNINFGNATPNIGWGPIEIHGVDSCYCDGVLVPCSTATCPGGSPLKQRIHQTVYRKISNSDTLETYTHSAGLMSYHQTHGHIHVDHWADFTLRRKTSNPDARTWPIIGTGTKQSFCLINLGDCSNNPGYCVRANGDTLTTDSIPNFPMGFVSGCGIDQGIYTGMLDIYSAGLNMGIDLAGYCNGAYYIVSITDPNNDFIETDDDNNWTAVPVTLGAQATPSTTDSCSFSYSITGNTDTCTVQFINTTPGVSSNLFWDFGDGNTSQEVNPIHQYLHDGDYWVKQELLTQCSRPDSVLIHVTINRTLGFSGLALPKILSLSMHPNPFKQSFTIDYVLSGNYPTQLELVDMLGRVIFSESHANGALGRQTQDIDLTAQGIRPGVYFLRLRSGAEMVHERLIKVE